MLNQVLQKRFHQQMIPNNIEEQPQDNILSSYWNAKRLNEASGKPFEFKQITTISGKIAAQDIIFDTDNLENDFVNFDDEYEVQAQTQENSKFIKDMLLKIIGDIQY